MEKIKWVLLKNKRKLIVTVGAFLTIFAILGCLFGIMTPDQRWYAFNNPIGLKVLATWHSLRKIPNLIHLPYWFSGSKLDIYDLYISAKDARDLNESLPLSADGLSYGKLYEDDKTYVSVDFESPSDGYKEKVKMRYRGMTDNNWSAEKRAIRIKFSKDNYFNGQKAINLILPEDRQYFSEMLDIYRAKKFGLFTASFKPVRVFINKRNFGVYYASEPWSKELLARNGYIDSNNIFSKIDKAVKLGYSMFFEENLPDWQSYTFDGAAGTTPEFEELKALLSLLNNADDKEFEKKIGVLVDLDKFYYWQIINTLAGSAHQNDWENTILLFRKETGKFEFVPWDIGVETDREIYKEASLLARRILGQKPFFDRYSELLKQYVSDEKNLADDLAYYDGLYNELKPEFYNDQAKIDNDLAFDSTVKDVRDVFVQSFNFAKKLGNYEDFIKNEIGDLDLGGKKSVEFTGSFSRFNEVFENIDNFVAKNPQFVKTDVQTVSLLAGTHIFNKTVIVPRGLNLVIDQGAELLFAPKTSLISYSSVVAVGSALSPISMRPLYFNDPWGVFAVVNTDEQNKFSFLHVQGGSTDTLNGIFFTSQFSIHNSHSIINNSIFEKSTSDDGIHIILGSVEIYNSIFKNNHADGIDLDYPTSVILKNNYFDDFIVDDSNGDALDLSGTVNTQIISNDIRNYGDKCISVGEGAKAEIMDNTLVGCNIGIAVKDASVVSIINNKILFNKTVGIDLYRKKQDWVIGGNVTVKDSILWGNGEEIKKDEYSKLDISNSTVEGGYKDGNQISSEIPDFNKLLPVNLWESLKNKLNG